MSESVAKRVWWEALRGLEQRARARRAVQGLPSSRRQATKELVKDPYGVVLDARRISGWLPDEVNAAQVPRSSDAAIEAQVWALIRLWSAWAGDNAPDRGEWVQWLADAQPARTPARGGRAQQEQHSWAAPRSEQWAQDGDAHLYGVPWSRTELPLPLPVVDAVPADGVVGLPRRPRPMFVGRESELKALRTALPSGQEGIAQVVVGLGGVGKSELALQFAHRHRDEYDLVWWLPAQSSSDVQVGLAELCRELCLRAGVSAAARVSSPEATGWALAWLAAHDRWLVLFDNAEHVGTLEPLLGRLQRGHVLVTSRLAMGWEQIGTVLRLPVLSTADAADLLARTTARTGAAPAAGTAKSAATDGRDSPTVRSQGPSSGTGSGKRGVLVELAQELGELPLALRQAGAYIAATAGVTASDYLERLRAAPQWALTARPSHHGPAPASPGGVGRRAEQVVATVWTVTLDRITQVNPLAVQLLHTLACYAPDRLPCRVLHGLPDTDRFQIGEALGVLAAYCLIDLSPDERHLSVHRLVQAVTRTTAVHRDPDLDTGQTAAYLLARALPQDPAHPPAWPLFAELVAHVRHSLAPDSATMATVVAYLDAIGDYRTACDLQHRRAASLQHVLGPEHPETLTSRAFLARYTGAAGDAVAARDLLTDLLPKLKRILGAEHPETLTARAFLAMWTGAAGDKAAARDLLTDLLPVRERISGSEHPDTLIARAFLAGWTGAAGDAAAARDLFADLLPLRERISGPEHPYTLGARSNLAGWTGAAGDAATARDLFADLLPLRERISGPEHPSTLGTRILLARWTGEAGDAATARDLLTNLLPARERISGPEHPDTLIARAFLARYTGEAGDAATARDLFADLLPLRERISGHEHPATLDARANLARWTLRAEQASGQSHVRPATRHAPPQRPPGTE
ncbi:tetratricopeptide repeat protein [Spirillospora sp. NPDC052269]